MNLNIFESGVPNHLQPLPFNKHAILFDLDGTLLNSRDFLVKASFEVLESYYPGLITYKQITDRFGDGFHKLVPNDGSTQYKQAIEQYHKIKLKHYHHYSEPFPEVVAGLRLLKENGIQLGIVTNQHKQVSINALKEFNMLPLFDVIIALEDVDEGKPSPSGINQALQSMNVPRSEAGMVGDSRADIAAAKQANVESFLLTWYKESQSVAELHPDHICSNMAELMCQLLRKRDT